MLGVFGDSFADSNEEPFPKVTRLSWPNQVARKLHSQIDNHAFSGTSLWYSYKKFLKNYKGKTHIVFVYTECNRWPSLPEELKRYSSIYSQEKLDIFPTVEKKDHKILQKLVDVHKYIFDEEFNQFVFQQIFDSVNKICRDNNIKLVNVLPFFIDEPVIDLANRHGSCITGLVEVSQNELRNYKFDGKLRHEKLIYFEKNGDYRANHLNSTNNNVLAEMICKEFESDTHDIHNAYHNSKFVYHPKLLLEYIDKLEEANVK